jgi:hypothetical protein
MSSQQAVVPMAGPPAVQPSVKPAPVEKPEVSKASLRWKIATTGAAASASEKRIGDTAAKRHLSFASAAKHVTVTKRAAKVWREAVDPRTGRKYYWNKHTRQTSFKRPAELDEPASGDTAPSPVSPTKTVVKETGHKSVVAADGGTWRETTDPKTGKPYWWNVETRETTRRDPSLASVASAAMKMKSAVSALSSSVAAKPATPTAAVTPLATTTAVPASGEHESAVKREGVAAPVSDVSAVKKKISLKGAIKMGVAATKAANLADWRSTTDPRTGRKYWWNKKTRQTTYRDPALQPAKTSGGMTFAGATTALVAKNRLRDVGEGTWKEVEDPRTGRKYWYHTRTRKTTYKNPFETDVPA